MTLQEQKLKTGYQMPLYSQQFNDTIQHQDSNFGSWK